MSEEEKKAIEKFERKIKRFSENPIKFNDVYTTLDITYLKIVLNIIENQQKEIENLKRLITESYISNDKLKAIVDEHIPKQPNIITGEMEYTPNTNANSFLVQDILKLLEA